MKLAVKSFNVGCSWLVLLAAVAGCSSTPRYRGEGQIKNTSYWADGLVHTTQYTIRLASFEMSTNVQREFDLGELSSWREPRLAVCVRFKDPRGWERLANSSARQGRIAASENWQNIDVVKSRFGYQLASQSGVLVSQPEIPLRDFNWGRGEFDPAIGDEHEISQVEHVRTEIPKGSKVKLSVSYTGDPSLTNRADFVVLWSWR